MKQPARGIVIGVAAASLLIARQAGWAENAFANPGRMKNRQEAVFSLESSRNGREITLCGGTHDLEMARLAAQANSYFYTFVANNDIDHSYYNDFLIGHNDVYLNAYLQIIDQAGTDGAFWRAHLSYASNGVDIGEIFRSYYVGQAVFSPSEVRALCDKIIVVLNAYAWGSSGSFESMTDVTGAKASVAWDDEKYEQWGEKVARDLASDPIPRERISYEFTMAIWRGMTKGDETKYFNRFVRAKFEEYKKGLLFWNWLYESIRSIPENDNTPYIDPKRR